MVIVPHRRIVGTNIKGAGAEIRTVTPEEMDDLVLRLTGIGVEIPSPEAYRGVWYDVGDACVLGFRLSAEHGMTIDVIRSGNEDILPKDMKIHQRGK